MSYQAEITVTFTKDVSTIEDARHAANQCIVAMEEAQISANLVAEATAGEPHKV